MTATINANLARCTCQRSMLIGGIRVHAKDCPGAPIDLPCPIPRSVEFAVRLGKCACVGLVIVGQDSPHTTGCPARPLRVTCSISGKTWAGSEVTEIAVVAEAPIDRDALIAACRERWALVKALVMGNDVPPGAVPRGTIDQRDQVYAALAEMARAEEVVYRRDAEIRTILGDEPGSPMPAKNRPSAFALERYVEHLIAQIGAVP